MVEQGKPFERDAVYDRLFPHIVVLSQNKFASNVVEKMLLHCTPAQRGAIVEEFLRQPSRRSSSDGVVSANYGSEDALRGCEQSALEQMMQDQYGNYVVQKTLEVRGALVGQGVSDTGAVNKWCAAVLAGKCRRCLSQTCKHTSN